MGTAFLSGLLLALWVSNPVDLHHPPIAAEAVPPSSQHAAFPPTSFAEAAQGCPTKKHAVHHYDHAYDHALDTMLRYRKRHVPTAPAAPHLDVLEIGAGNGAGFCLLSKWLPGMRYTPLNSDATLDSSPTFLSARQKARFDRFKIVLDQCNDSSWQREEAHLGDYDVIIDAGVRDWACQRTALLANWHRLRAGGLYVVENTAVATGGSDTFATPHSMGRIVRDLQLVALERFWLRSNWWRNNMVPKEDINGLRDRFLPFADEVQRLACDPEVCVLLKVIPGAYWLEAAWKD